MKNALLFAVIGFLVLTGCSQTKPVRTISDLKEAIKGETTASAKYAAFAKKTRDEGLNSIAKLFEAASKSESIHALNHTKVLEELGEKMEQFKPKFEVKSTPENLETAFDGESYEIASMYPRLLKDAGIEKAVNATISFTWAMDTEKKHKEFYRQAIQSLKTGADFSSTPEYAVCPVCGNTYLKNSVDDNCAFCRTPKEKFLTI